MGGGGRRKQRPLIAYPFGGVFSRFLARLDHELQEEGVQEEEEGATKQWYPYAPILRGKRWAFPPVHSQVSQ
jgi:hypothetical protein